jgi:hypothetical protein
MLDVKDFTKDVLKQIAEAVKETRLELKSDNITVSNAGIDYKAGVSAVQFDVAVTISESNSSEGRAGIFVLGDTGLGGKKQKEKDNSIVSRISYELILQFPIT